MLTSASRRHHGPRTQRLDAGEPGHLFFVRLRPKARRQGHHFRSLREFFIKETEAKWCTSAVVPAWRRCVALVPPLPHVEDRPQGDVLLRWTFKRELFYVDDFRAIEKELPNFKFHLVLSEPAEGDSGWNEKKDIHDEGDGLGFVHNAVIDHREGPRGTRGHRIYFCGPPMMNQAVLKMCDDWGVPSENVAFDDCG